MVKGSRKVARFLESLLVYFMSNLNTLLQKAIDLAHQAHAQQVDKGGQPYINHPLRVRAKMETPQEKIVAVLHDVVEDSDLTLEDLLVQGFPADIVDSIAALTKIAGEEYETYLQ